MCPRLFFQLFTIHSFSHGKQFLLVYFLLPNKTRETYNMAFLLLKESCQNYHISLDPPKVKTDFELALVQSIHISFPNVSFRGYYHFSQAIRRKVQSIGLQQEYQTHVRIRSKEILQESHSTSICPNEICLHDLVWPKSGKAISH